MSLEKKRVLVHKLLWRLGAINNKLDYLKEYNVTSTTDLTNDQLDHLIKRLNESVGKYKTNFEIRQWRSTALSLLNKCGVYVTNNDWERVNRFMLDKRICGKLLYELNVNELKGLCVKLRNIAAKKEKKDKALLVNGISLN